ncbi:MAG: hypothetical protein COC01_10050 [Bacteroidetes bacterium]|nr:MAG: hypothetical protein COC01_10050 [Bacteroidota bacterium]
MAGIKVHKIDLDNFQFEELDNRLIEEMKELINEGSSALDGGRYELPHHSELPERLKGMYTRYDLKGRNQHFGTKDTIYFALNLAYNWWLRKLKPQLLIGDISAKNFSDTKGHKSHKTGTHIDLDLSYYLPKDADYDIDKKTKCAILCGMMLALGAKRVLFNDRDVMTAVNQFAVKNNYSGRVVDGVPGHDNHFHAELPL